MTRPLYRALAVTSVVVAAAVAACGPPSKPSTDQRLWTDDFEIRVTSDPMPPRAAEATAYTIYVRDKKTREPIVNGEGRI